MSDWVTVGNAQSIATGQCSVVEVDEAMIAIYNIDGQFFAIEDVCTHDGGELASGKLDGDQVICPRHGARFCVRTGAALSPPAYDAVHCFPLRVVDGVIQVRDDRWD